MKIHFPVEHFEVDLKIKIARRLIFLPDAIGIRELWLVNRGGSLELEWVKAPAVRVSPMQVLTFPGAAIEVDASRGGKPLKPFYVWREDLLVKASNDFRDHECPAISLKTVVPKIEAWLDLDEHFNVKNFYTTWV